MIDRLPNLRNLHVFASVAASGSVTRSADNLFRAQSAITRSVKALEDELGVALFERKARGMLLNEYGRVVQQRAMRIEQELMSCCIELSALRRVPPPAGLLHVLLNEQRLQAFVELTRHHHLGTVANLRGVSRTAISVSIRELVLHLQVKLFERSAMGLRLRASREDEPAARAAGISVVRERTVAFGLSGGVIALGGAVYAHFIGSFDPYSFYLELTFITLAMLVVGGASSLWGAVVGALLISALNSFLADAEQGVHVGFDLHLPTGTRLVAIGVVMSVILILRPSGLTGGREAALPRLRRAGPMNARR